MPNDSPSDNKAYCKGYYSRLKQDPLKWQAFLEKRSRYKKSRKPVNPVNPRAVSHGKTAQVPCEPPVNPAPKKLPSKEELKAIYEERAAIMENDGKLSKEAAEEGALDEILKMLGSP